MKTYQFATRSGFMMMALPSVLLLLANAGDVSTPQLARRQPVEPAAPEHAITLAVGQNAQVDSLGITFSRIVQDSRCPSDVVCVWAGDAAVELLVTGPETDRTELTLHTTLDPKEDTVDGYRVRLASVAPYPKIAAPIPLRDYRVTLIVSKNPPAHDPNPTE
jgi:hypothetical protein